MRKVSSLALIGFVPLVTLAAGCGGNETTASKSAAAFDAAKEKGMSPGAGQAHGGHGQAGEPEGSPTATLGSGASNMGGMDHAGMPGMQGGSGARPPAGAGSSMAGMNHSKVPGTRGGSAARPAGAGSSMAGMGHSRMPGMGTTSGARPAPAGAGSSMAGMDHSTMAQRPGATAAPPLPDRPVAVATPGQPAATLRPDDVDSPVPTAIREAARSAEMAMQMAGGGHGMQHGTYRQIDAGREDVTPAPQGGHEGHQAAPPPPSSSADPHGMHTAPARPVTQPPASAPRNPRDPQAAPSTPDPHAMHAAPPPKPAAKPSPRPTPAPRPKEDNR